MVIIIGSYEDFEFVNSRWDITRQKYKLSARQEKILKELESFESEEEFIEYVENVEKKLENARTRVEKSKVKNEHNFIHTLSKKLSVGVETLKIEKNRNWKTSPYYDYYIFSLIFSIFLIY